jgi:hypothetical protein
VIAFPLLDHRKSKFALRHCMKLKKLYAMTKPMIFDDLAESNESQIPFLFFTQVYRQSKFSDKFFKVIPLLYLWLAQKENLFKFTFSPFEYTYYLNYLGTRV